MKCRWCGFKSEDIEEFEEDYKYHKGVWCPECEGFTYFNENETLSSYDLMLEKRGEEIKIHRQVKLNKQLSPLRYPGGKSKLADMICGQIDANKKVFVEPFCGGASVSLALLEAGVMDRIVLNDLDFGIYSLFNLILHDTDWLVKTIRNYKPTKEDYFKNRSLILSNYKYATERQAGFAMITVNRMAFSGVVRANPMRDLNSRWNPEKLIKRINWISGQKDNIKLSNQDAEDIIEEYYWPRENILFIDPPYYVKGRSLYNLYYKEYQHKALADLLNSLYCSYPECADILITYDNDQFIKELFPHSSVKEIGRTFSIAN